MLEAVQGSLLDLEGIEALVIPANRQLTLGWGTHVAEQVLRRGGREIEEEALRLRPRGIALGEAVVTGPGRLPFRLLIHAAVLDKYDFNPLFLLKIRQRTSDETLARACRASLEACRAQGLASVAFSPMGAGVGGMPIGKCARIMVAAALETPVGRVVFAALKEAEVEAFRRAIRETRA